MNRVRLVIAAFIFTLISPAVLAQKTARDFSFISESSPWLRSRNSSGLDALPLNKVSTANLSFIKGDGGLMDIQDSPDFLKVEAGTESFVKVSPKITFHGKMAWSYFDGDKMGGPVLMDPSYNFLNFEESTDTTTGHKILELFTLEGGVSWKVSDKLSFGSSVAFQSGEYAKRKDPRHDNDWMDLRFSAGARYKLSEAFIIGADFEYRRTVESLVTKIFGITGKDYYYVVDFGGYFGNRIILGTNSGYVPSGSPVPMQNNFYGGALQADLTLGKVNLFNDFSFLLRKGTYGNRASSEILFEEANSYIASYSGTLNLYGRHLFKITGSYSPMQAYKNNYRESTEQGESTEIQYYGQQQTLDRTEIKAGLSYTGYFGVNGFLPATTAGASVNARYNDFTSENYPFYRKQSTLVLNADAYAKHNFVKGSNIFTPCIQVSWQQGSGVMNEDGRNVSAEGSPFTQDTYLRKNYEYLTIGRAGAGVSFRYTRVLSDRFSLFANISDNFTIALSEPEYLAGKTYNRMVLTLGCTF